MFDITIQQSTARFFDRASVVNSMDAATHKALAKIGAFVRKRAQQSLKSPSKKARELAEEGGISPVSRPGSPPFSHSGKIKKFLYFDYDKVNKTVVIGPKKLNGVIGPRILMALEFGGTSVVRDSRSRRLRHKLRPINVKARPFMGPALEAEKPKFAGIFAEFLP